MQEGDSLAIALEEQVTECEVGTHVYVEVAECGHGHVALLGSKGGIDRMTVQGTFHEVAAVGVLCVGRDGEGDCSCGQGHSYDWFHSL